ncbi:PIN domain-containing protein [Rhizobium sp. L1K21]|uniref:type II toxin-antitoxin system VapC family toxin n=1 Tax=Rhizobium sp. L1K21 TaxID=2954933 RepID=UPI002092A020|nr:type II toxin-antitoxin system VapC family toxin [Rhizobium sp. L1K21]
MSARFILDTNIVSDMLRNPTGASARRGSMEKQSAICISVVTACELRFGAAKRASQSLVERVERFIASFPVLPFELEFAHDYADIRNDLERAGTPIGPNDLLIAAHARALDLTLVTDNIAEFARVRDLKLENWLERSPT